MNCFQLRLTPSSSYRNNTELVYAQLALWGLLYSGRCVMVFCFCPTYDSMLSPNGASSLVNKRQFLMLSCSGTKALMLITKNYYRNKNTIERLRVGVCFGGGWTKTFSKKGSMHSGLKHHMIEQKIETTSKLMDQQ